MNVVKLIVPIKGDIKTVFAAVADHERFFVGNGIKHCDVTQPGNPDRNGLGAVREIVGGGGVVKFVEKINAFDPPHSFEYRITDCTIPADHQLGRLEFKQVGEMTEVTWETRFTINVPIIGGYLGKIAAPRFEALFRKLLQQVKV